MRAVDGEEEKRLASSPLTFLLSLSRLSFLFLAFPAAFAMAQANRNPAAHPWHDLPIQAEVNMGMGGSLK